MEAALFSTRCLGLVMDLHRSVSTLCLRRTFEQLEDCLGQREENSRTLVVVDDEPVILELLQELFQEEYELFAYSDGASAMEGMLSHGVDVLLTDKNLPDIGGLELLERAKELQSDAEVLLITGYASLDSALTALQKGAFDYIIKPPRSIFDIRRKVDAAFEHQRLERQNRSLVRNLQDKNAELEAALEENRRVQAELIQSEKLAGIGTLAAGIAHEVSSPLFGVLGLAEAICDEADAERAKGFAEEIVEYATTIKEIVEQLRGYSRSAAYDEEERTDIMNVVNDAIKLVVRTSDMDASVVHVQGAQDVIVNARSNEIGQVLINLVKNAYEALDEAGGLHDGAIEVRVEHNGPNAQIVVSDDGPGIPQGRLKDIFDPFYTTKPPGQGTGLGLNIVYRIITRHRGVIRASNAPSGGARFTIELPLADS